MSVLALFILLVLLYSLVSKRIDRSVLTAPILFTSAGLGAFFLWAEYGELGEIGRDVFLHVAELGLVLLLFSDANRIGQGMLEQVR